MIEKNLVHIYKAKSQIICIYGLDANETTFSNTEKDAQDAAISDKDHEAKKFQVTEVSLSEDETSEQL